MDRTRLRITVNGIVQGVGFRPFVFRLARDRKLTGWVSNTASGVILEVEGSPEAVRSFPDLIRASAPPLALIDTIATETLPPNGDVTFAIRPSRQEDPVHTLISPDAAVCPDCLRELFDPSDRRYRYPFINCTNCGPRYTIIRSIPYD
ncbi:MAG: carbamoyltransferase HypF, partial [Candidatus Neomarinimicrobiota bacterium]